MGHMEQRDVFSFLVEHEEDLEGDGEGRVYHESCVERERERESGQVHAGLTGSCTFFNTNQIFKPLQS